MFNFSPTLTFFDFGQQQSNEHLSSQVQLAVYLILFRNAKCKTELKLVYLILSENFDLTFIAKTFDLNRMVVALRFN